MINTSREAKTLIICTSREQLTRLSSLVFLLFPFGKRRDIVGDTIRRESELLFEHSAHFGCRGILGIKGHVIYILSTPPHE